MPLLDYNYNYNYNYSAGGGGGMRFRPRDNTDIYPRLVPDFNQPVVPPEAAMPPAATRYPLFHENWDANLHSYMFLADFITAVAGWRASYTTVARNAGIPAQDMTQGYLNGQVMQILQLALEREDRYDEVIDQDDGDGAVNYYLGMLKIDPARHPGTYLMVCVGRRIGEYIAMILKGDFRSPRPPQLSPWIEPMIDPPVTPSFPAGHAIQSYLISYLLGYSLPGLPQQAFPPAGNQQPVPPAMAAAQPTPGSLATGSLFTLADRISENRIVAGIHYPDDIAAGQAVAIQCFLDLQNVPSIWGNIQPPAPPSLQMRVQAEFPQYA